MLYETALYSVNSRNDVILGPVQVCEICGYTLEGEAPDKCPLCTEGLKGKQYLGGLLIHLALTRVPANIRTDIDVEVDKSMTTRKSDAASIVGEELANEIEEKAKLVNSG